MATLETEEPEAKKQKIKQEDEEEEEETVEAKLNENGEAYFELSNLRRVTVRKFKGTTLIDIREVSTRLL